LIYEKNKILRAKEMHYVSYGLVAVNPKGNQLTEKESDYKEVKV